MTCSLQRPVPPPALPLHPPARPVTVSVALAGHIAAEELEMTATDQVRISTSKSCLISQEKQHFAWVFSKSKTPHTSDTQISEEIHCPAEIRLAHSIPTCGAGLFLNSDTGLFQRDQLKKRVCLCMCVCCWETDGSAALQLGSPSVKTPTLWKESDVTAWLCVRRLCGEQRNTDLKGKTWRCRE